MVSVELSSDEHRNSNPHEIFGKIDFLKTLPREAEICMN